VTFHRRSPRECGSAVDAQLESHHWRGLASVATAHCGIGLTIRENAPADDVSTSAGLARFSRKPTTATALPWVVIRAVAHKKNPDAHLVRAGRQPLNRRGLGQRHQCSSCARELPVRAERTSDHSSCPSPCPHPRRAGVVRHPDLGTWRKPARRYRASLIDMLEACILVLHVGQVGAVKAATIQQSPRPTLPAL
jgi:hypothetical protein